MLNDCLNCFSNLKTRRGLHDLVGIAGIDAVVLQRLINQPQADRKKEDLDTALATALGSAIFSVAADLQQCSGFSVDLEPLLEPLRKAVEIDEAMLATFLTQSNSLQSKYRSTLDEVRKKRQVEIEYFERKITIEVCSMIEEASMEMHAVLKMRAVGFLEGAPIMTFEQGLVKDNSTKKTAVPPHMVIPMCMAREMLTAALEGGENTGEYLKQRLDQKHDDLADVDPSWNLDKSYLTSLAGSAGEVYLLKRITPLMPTPAKLVEPSEVPVRKC